MYVPAWPGLSPRHVLPLGARTAPPFPLSSAEGIYFSMARNGIYHLLRALGFHAGQTILVPDYHHGVEVQAIQAAGASIRYYSINRHLEPDLDELAWLCGSNPRALYVIHFLGWPQPIDELAALCRERGIVLIEDCALALLSAARRRPLGTFGDYAVFCLYKTLPVPNGGLLVRNAEGGEGLKHLKLAACSRVAVGGRSLDLALEWVRGRSDRLGRALGLPKKALARVLDGLGVERVSAGTAAFDPAHANLGMSPLCHRLLKRFDYERIRQTRTTNFLRMQDRLAGSVTVPRKDLGEGVCPLFFPVLVPDRRAAARALRQRGIGPLEWWSHAAPVPGIGAESQFLRDHLLGLPIHQDVTRSQVDYMADQVLRLDLCF